MTRFLPRFVRRWWLQYLRWEASENLKDSLRWLDETPAKLTELRKFIDACDTDLRLLESGSRTTYSARQKT